MTCVAFFRCAIERPLAAKALCGLVLLTGAPVLCAQSYIVQDLGTLDGGDLSNAYGINNLGQVVGGTRLFLNGVGTYHATLFSGTGANNTDLGTLGGSY